MKYQPTNREKSRAARSKGESWCVNCDAWIVNVAGKCPKCGKRQSYYRKWDKPAKKMM